MALHGALFLGAGLGSRNGVLKMVGERMNRYSATVPVLLHRFETALDFAILLRVLLRTYRDFCDEGDLP